MPARHGVHVVEDNMEELVLSSHQVGPRVTLKGQAWQHVFSLTGPCFTTEGLTM